MAGEEGWVSRLMPVSDPHAVGHSYQDALMCAVMNRQEACAKLLLPVSDPRRFDSWALAWAAKENWAPGVGMLLPASDALAGHSQALRWAAQRGHGDCVDLLLPASDPLAAPQGEPCAIELARAKGFEDLAQKMEAFVDKRELGEASAPAGRAAQARL